MSKLLKEYTHLMLTESNASNNIYLNFKILLKAVKDLKFDKFGLPSYPKDVSVNYITDYISKSQELYTNANVELIRKILYSIYDAVGGEYVDTSIMETLAKSSFSDLHLYINRLGLSIHDESIIYRGMTLETEKANQLVKGAIFDHGDTSSWSYSLDIANRFAVEEYSPIPENMVSVIFECKNPLRGVPIEALSEARSEEEVISSGLVKIIDRELISANDESNLVFEYNEYDLVYLKVIQL